MKTQIEVREGKYLQDLVCMVNNTNPGYYVTDLQVQKIDDLWVILAIATKDESEEVSECEYCCYEDEKVLGLTGRFFTSDMNVKDKTLSVETDLEAETIDIKYCPMCGRKLG